MIPISYAFDTNGNISIKRMKERDGMPEKINYLL